MSEKIINPLISYNYKRMCCAVKNLQEKYNGLLCMVYKGKSTQGRSIPVLSLGFGKRKILGVSAVHGREYVTTGYILLCLEEYLEDFCKKTKCCGFDVSEILSEFTFHIVPMANPDSVEIALGEDVPNVKTEDFCPYLYKNNANNVNINANFPFEWQCVPKERQGGICEASEAETKFLMKLCMEQKYEKLLSFHSRGHCLYWQDAGNGEIEKDRETAQTLKEFCGFSLCPPTKKKAGYSGGFENWFRHEFAKPGICVELIKDNKAPFDVCCSDFYNLSGWEQTKCALLAICDV